MWYISLKKMMQHYSWVNLFFKYYKLDLVKKWPQVFSRFTHLQLKSDTFWELVLLNHCCLIKKYKLTVWIIQNLILTIKMTCTRKWISWLGCTRQCKNNRKQLHIQNQPKFLPWYLMNGLELYCSEYLKILK